MSLPTPDRSVIRRFGENIIFTPAAGGGPFTVKLVRENQGTRAAGSLLVFFGTVQDSNFTVRPVVNDLFTVQGEEYRLYDVKEDWAGGTDDTAGLWLHLDRTGE